MLINVNAQFLCRHRSSILWKCEVSILYSFIKYYYDTVSTFDCELFLNVKEMA